MSLGPESAEAAFHPCAIPTKAGGQFQVRQHGREPVLERRSSHIGRGARR
jgi:hypothetical protein